MNNNIYKIIEENSSKDVKKYRNLWALSGKGEVELEYPLHINFELTFGCNLKCEFCTHSLPLKDWNYKVNPQKKISFEKYCEIIDEGVKKGLYSICLNGNNEPLFLKENIISFIDYASFRGIIETSFHTNGLLLTEELSHQLIDSDLTTIMFSVDAFNKDTYSKTRGGDFSKVIENIENFVKIKESYKKKFPLTRVSFFKNKLNIEELDNFINFWERKIDYIEVQSFCNLFVDTNKYEEIQHKYNIEDIKLKSCYEPYRRLSIKNDGDVFPCCSTYGNEIILGNIYKNSLYDIWNNEKTKEIRKNIRENNTEQPLACIKCKKSGEKYGNL